MRIQLSTALLTGVIAFTGCQAVSEANMPFSASDEETLARKVFAQLQPLSFENDREYCGYIGFDFDGNLAASEANKGTVDGCTPQEPAALDIITSSYHTHGAYGEDYASETPSVDDIESDEAEGVDGWVATPGGRLWFIDTEDMTLSQVCSIGCLEADPNFVEDSEIPIEQSYTYDELVSYFDD